MPRQLCRSINGSRHEIFCFKFFSWISFLRAAEYPIRTFFSNFYDYSRRYLKVKVITSVYETGNKWENFWDRKSIRNLMARCWLFSIFLTQAPFLPLSQSLFFLCSMRIYTLIQGGQMKSGQIIFFV